LGHHKPADNSRRLEREREKIQTQTHRMINFKHRITSNCQHHIIFTAFQRRLLQNRLTYLQISQHRS